MSQSQLSAPCPCGSGNDYLHCCGYMDSSLWDEHALGRMPGNLTDPQWSRFIAKEPTCVYDGRSLPPGIFLKDMGGEIEWPILADAVSKRDEVSDALTGGKGSERKRVWRETKIVDPGENAETILELVRLLFRDQAEPFFGRKLRSLESPHVLRYSPGSYYRPHADSDRLNPDTNRWEKVRDRDVSLLFYLDDGYTGGEITFPNFEFKIRPRPGTLLMFPSDCRYLHGVLPVTQGVRHTIVSWCAMEAPRVK